MAFSATEAAFEGFRMAREKPGAIIAWAVFYLLYTVLLTAALVQVMGPEMSTMMQQGREPTTDPAEAMALLQTLGKLYAVLLPLGLVFSAVLLCAVYRAVLRPQEKGLGYLKFGGDELRMMLLFVILFLLFLVFYVVILIAGSVVGVAVGAAAAAAGGQPSAIAGIFVVVSSALMLAALIYFLVRLSLAGPATFARRKLTLGAAWRMTKGRFWSLFGAYLLAVVLALVVMLLVYAIGAGVALAVGGGMEGLTGMFMPDFSSLQAYFSPGRIALTLVGSVVSGLIAAIMYAPAAVAYRELSGEGVSA